MGNPCWHLRSGIRSDIRPSVKRANARMLEDYTGTPSIEWVRFSRGRGRPSSTNSVVVRSLSEWRRLVESGDYQNFPVVRCKAARYDGARPAKVVWYDNQVQLVDELNGSVYLRTVFGE